MLKRLIIYACLISFLLPLASCRKERRWRIGVSQCSRDDWRSKMNDEINRELMFHENASVEIRSADDDNEKQISDVRYFADNGFDIIIVAPNEADALTPVIQEVYERGVPVVIFDRDIIGDTYTARLGVDNAGIGRQAAHYARHLITGPVNVLEVQGLAGSTPAAARHSGFLNGMAAEKGMRIVATGYGDWNKEDAVPLVDSLLSAHPETSLIYAHNDRMAIGASEVAEARGRRDIKIIGVDAAPNIGIQAVADSVIDATFLYPTEGHRLVRLALAILEGREYSKEERLPLSSAVDLSNADILLLQNESLKEETDKMKMLKSRVDEYWERHSAQTSLFYAAIVIVVLLSGLVFLLLRAFWQHKRHRLALMEQNRLLEGERDKQKVLNERLEEATQSKLAFFTNVSHDLRTPLTLIAGPVEQLQGAGNLTDQQKSLLSIAVRNISILKRLINEILDFRTLENGKMKLHIRYVDFARLAGEWCDSFVEMARRRHFRLICDIDDSVRERCVGIDVEKIERVFFNLMGNAFKYTPDNGTVTFATHIEGDRLVFSVSDTGEGIPPEELDAIFSRFYQVDRVRPRGSGIGLSLAKAFVELHGGTVEVESTCGKGSVFTVSIPLGGHGESETNSIAVSGGSGCVGRSAMAAELLGDADFSAVAVSDNDAAGHSDDSRPLLLVIDDNADLRTMLTNLMSDDYRVITATDGRQGIKLASRFVPDLIICDIMMPGMDGLECCRILKDELATSHIPVLMLTACSMDRQRVEGYESGADGYLAKPFGYDVLRARCNALILNRKKIKASVQLHGITAPVAPKHVDATPLRTPTDIDSEFYRKFVEIVNADMGNPELGVDELAGRMGLGRSQFYRKIKALTNFSPVELLRDMRLQRARALLASSEKTISEIAYETGFSTPAYFTKCFREAFGHTPSEFRGRIG